MKPLHFVRSRGRNRGLYGIRFKELKPYQVKFLENNPLIRKNASTDDRYVQVIFRILEYETHYKDHLKLYYNTYTGKISNYEEIIEESKKLDWKCSVCSCDIKSEIGNFEIKNFLCETCNKSHGKPSKFVDERILDSSVNFRKHCQDILRAQQKSYMKYIKRFEKGHRQIKKKQEPLQ
jgi:hypothetical protein